LPLRATLHAPDVRTLRQWQTSRGHSGKTWLDVRYGKLCNSNGARDIHVRSVEARRPRAVEASSSHRSSKPRYAPGRRMSTSPDATSFEPTIIAGRYRVERLLGQGGMGSVYEVHDQATGKQVALKRLSRGAPHGAAALFQREYHTLAGLRHPAIVEVYDYGADGDGAYFTMELVEGSDLGKQSPLPWREACACLRDVAATVGLLHARRLAHRDLSPRNLLRTPSGRLKLIDFGALVPFGPTQGVVGTPPFVAPEAVHDSGLDQRADLFALGALGYWLITGTHAFPARSLAELPRVWQHSPAPPSTVLARAADRDRAAEPIPSELDTLLCALLSLDASERPPTTGVLIDRLNVIAELEPEASELSRRGYLDSKAFVGRAREREHFGELLLGASQGHGAVLLLTGAPGMGRTRLMQELTVLSRLSGTITLTTDARHGEQPFGALNDLAIGLLNALPEEATRAAAPFVASLSGVSAELRERLATVAAKAGGTKSSRGSAIDARLRHHAALRDWLLAVSALRPLALLVDDLHTLDESSQAVLTELSFCVSREQLLIAASSRVDVEAPSPALQSFYQLAERWVLEPLGAPEMLELLRSVFGEVPYLERCAQRLWRASEGNPAYCLELAHHLVSTGTASYLEGVWSLPVELPAEQLPTSRAEGLLARLTQLSDDERRVAQTLSLPHPISLTLAQCQVLSELEPSVTDAAITSLVNSRVLRSSARGYRLAHELVRAQLYGELDAQRRKRAHRLLAEQLLNQPEPSHQEQLIAGIHLLRAGDRLRARPLLTRVGVAIGAGDRDSIRVAAPLFEEAYLLQRAAGADCYELGTPLTLLANAGYYAHRHYASNYGELAIAALTQVLELDLQKRLRPYLGRKLSLVMALGVARRKLAARKEYAPSLRESISQLISASLSLNATATVCLDGDSARRYAEVIEPFTALGPEHVATVSYEFASLLALQPEDRVPETARRTREFIALLESNRPIEGLTAQVRSSYLVGAYFPLGIREVWRDGGEALRIADRIEQAGELLHLLNADYLRYCHYCSQGDAKQAARFQKRVELHAAQLGTAWQVETWGCVSTAGSAYATNDIALLKRSCQELARLSLQIPALKRMEQKARGMYLLLRGKYERAIPLLESFPEPMKHIGWLQVRGLIARAYNGLGQHRRALDVCVEALSYATDEDLTYPAMNQIVEIERALAEAGLGNFVEAGRQLDELLVQRLPNKGPLTLGALHEARAKVALMQGDLTSCREHLKQMDGWYRATGMSSLIELVERLGRALLRAEQPGYEHAGSPLQTHDELLSSQLSRMLTQHADAPMKTRAEEALQVALDLTSAAAGFVIVPGSAGKPLAYAGGAAPQEELVRWAHEILQACDPAIDSVEDDQVTSALDASSRELGGVQYLFTPLWAGDAAVGAVVLGFAAPDRQLPDARLWNALARHLAPREHTA
jgi:hypothetical protein